MSLKTVFKATAAVLLVASLANAQTPSLLEHFNIMADEARQAAQEHFTDNPDQSAYLNNIAQDYDDLEAAEGYHERTGDISLLCARTMQMRDIILYQDLFIDSAKAASTAKARLTELRGSNYVLRAAIKFCH